MEDTNLAYGQPEEQPQGPELAYGVALPTAPQLSDKALTERAARADFALGDKSPGQEILKDSFSKGNEGVVRQTAAVQANSEFQNEKIATIQQAQSKGAPITDKDVNTILSIGTTPEANPNTVLEDKFAKNFVNTGVIGDPTKNLVFQAAFSNNPDDTQLGIKTATAAVSKNHIVKGVREDTEAAVQNLPWFNTSEEGRDQQDKAGNMFKNILTGGFAAYVNQRNLLFTPASASLLPGSNQLEQIQALYLLPHDQIRPTLMAAAGPGSEFFKKAPLDALEFVKAAEQFSTSDAYVNNVMGIVNTATMIPFGTGIKAFGLLRNGKTVTQTSESITSAAKVAEDILKGSSKPPVTPASGAFGTARQVLGESSKPPTAGYYVPTGIVQKEDLSTKAGKGFVPRNIQTVAKDGVPTIIAEDGSIPVLSRTPQEGYHPVTVEPPVERKTYTNKDGIVPYEVSDGRTTANDKATVFVDKKSYEKLSQVLDEAKGSQILEDPKNGKFFVGDLKTGKEIRGSRVSVSHEPQEGLYPVHLPEGTDKIKFEDFGSRITKVATSVDEKVNIGPKIVSASEVEARTALADITKAQAETHPVDVLSKMGMHEEAATIQAKDRIATSASDVVPLSDPEAIRRLIPSRASPQVYFSQSASLTQERSRRLADMAVQRDITIGKALTDPTRIERLTKEGLEQAIDNAKNIIKTRPVFNRNPDAIIDQATIWDSASNTYYVQSKFGKRDGTLFDSSAQATHYKNLQYKLGNSVTVEQEGTKFYLSHIQHADEVAKDVRDGLIVAQNSTPIPGLMTTFFNALAGKAVGGGNVGLSIRSSRYTQAEFQMDNRIKATHAPSILRQAIEEASDQMRALGRFSKTEMHELQRITGHNRDFMNPDGTRGFFYNSQLEFETAFNNMHGHMPSERQSAAYEQYTRLSDLDATLRILDLHREKTRLGIRNYQLPYTQIDNATGIPSNLKTEWFNGKRVDNFDPLNTQNANVWIADKNKLTTKFDLRKETVEDLEIAMGIKEGKYQIIQIYNPGSKPLREATGIKDNIHFVVTSKYDDKALVPGDGFTYQPGGHVIYKDPLFLKQPQIGTGTTGRLTHFGDTTMKSFTTPKEAAMWEKRYNTARELLHNNDEAGLKAYIDAGNLPETLPEFKKMFTDGGLGLSTEHPFVITANGRDTFQSSQMLREKYPELKDTFSSYDLTQTSSARFMAERDRPLNTVANVGTEDNPVYNNVPSRLYDPFTALQKGIAQIVRERWMGDYKISAAESWVREFGQLFDQSTLPLAKLQQNPTYWLYHAKGNIDIGIARTNPEMVTAAMVARQNILNFIGARDEVGAVLDGLQMKLVSKIENVAGAKTAEFANEKFLPAITSAPEYARAAASHITLGMFNPIQLWQQAQGFVHILFLSPLNAIHSMTALSLARMYRYTEDAGVLANMADKAAAMGWNRDHFIEAYGAWKSSGTHAVSGESALLQQAADPALARGVGSWLLDKGMFFFKAGESVVRDGAFFTAYRDWRAANPTLKLDNRAMGDILNRFDTLSMNMTRASNAVYNEGALSIPTQFFTWNARFAEQMWGKQLTNWEKARALVGYSFMYGVPATLGGVTFGLIPHGNYQDVRQYALTNGINVSDKYFESYAEGIPAMLTNMLTGHSTDYQRFGPNASQIKDIIDGKKSAIEIFGGASGGFIQKALQTMSPFYAYIINAFKKDSGFPLKGNDFKGFAELISSFNNAQKMVIGLNIGQYIQKNESKVLNDIDTFESIMLGLGLQPKRASDAYAVLDFAKQQAETQKIIGKRMTEDWKIALRAGARGDMQTMSDYAKRVQFYSAAGNFTKQQEIDLFKMASKDSGDLLDAANKWMLNNNQALRSVPAMNDYLKAIEGRR